jgi:hypothetical protein
MKERNLIIGGTVYHTLLHNRGKGEVLKYRTKNHLGESTAYRVLVLKYSEGCGTLDRPTQEPK